MNVDGLPWHRPEPVDRQGYVDRGRKLQVKCQ